MDKCLPRCLRKYRRKRQNADDINCGETNKNMSAYFLKKIRRKKRDVFDEQSEKDRQKSKPDLSKKWLDLLTNPVKLFNYLAFPAPPGSSSRTRTSLDDYSNRRRDVLIGHAPDENLDLVAHHVPAQPTSRTRTLLDHHRSGSEVDMGGLLAGARHNTRKLPCGCAEQITNQINVEVRNTKRSTLSVSPTGVGSESAIQSRFEAGKTSYYKQPPLQQHALSASGIQRRPYTDVGSESTIQYRSEAGKTSYYKQPPLQQHALSASGIQRRPYTDVSSESTIHSRFEAIKTTYYKQPPLQQHALSASGIQRRPYTDVSSESTRKTTSYEQPSLQLDLSASQKQVKPTVVRSELTIQSGSGATYRTPLKQPPIQQYDLSASQKPITPFRQLPIQQYDLSASQKPIKPSILKSKYATCSTPLRQSPLQQYDSSDYYDSDEDSWSYQTSGPTNQCVFDEGKLNRRSDGEFRLLLKDPYGNKKPCQPPITDIGRWLSTSIEPRFGCMIEKGYEMGFVYDTIVLTALCSITGSIFYRGGNDEEKKENDLINMKFCDSKGDAFTYLKIYKEWEQVPERQKNEWCYDNALNSKSLRGARELVNEICSVFRENWSIEVKKRLATETELNESLQKFILFAFYDNIAHFLGHNRMGYYVPNLQQRVFVHPTSALNALNDSSQWLVFINTLETSKDYITIVTPVEESWIRWASRFKINKFNINAAKRRSVCSVRNQFFGTTTYSYFVGPAHKKLREYEDLLYEVPVVVDADRTTGEVKFISSLNATLPDDLIEDWIAEAKSQVLEMSAEFKVGSNNQAGGVRIVVGLGGEGQFILMPDEYRTVHIKSWNNETSKEAMVEKFKRFGKIIDCWEEKRPIHRWGRVSFSTPEAAAEAVRRTQNDPIDAAAPEFVIQKHASYQYEATIEWLRRKPTGLVFVEMDHRSAQSATSLREVRILGQPCAISLGKKKRSTVLLHRVPKMATEQDIRDCFPHHWQRRAITKINFVREKIFTNPNELPHFQQQIRDQFREYDQGMKFVVDVMKPFGSNINFRAFIKFNDAFQGTTACDDLQGRLTINGQRATITPKLSTSLSVTEQVYQLLQQEIENFVTESEDVGTEFKINIRKLNNGRRVFNISATNSNDLVQVRMGLSAITKGEVIECWRNENNRYLFLKSGRDFLRSLEKRTNTILQVDNRLLSLRVFGNEKNIFEVQNAIRRYLGNMVESDGRREIKLDGESQPKGLMKSLVTRYDLELDDFVQASGLRSAFLNHRTQTLNISGDSASMKKATGLIESLAAELRNKNTNSKCEDMPDCCTCFCPVESNEHMYRLEACGHLYCLDCIKRQITVAVKNKELPVLCGKCRDPLVWSDFQFCFKRLEINPLDLVTTAVSVYMSKNKDGYRHCLTSDCPMVYRITKRSDIFNCIECGLRICTFCHVEYHDGLTCAMMKNSIADTVMEKYLKENAKRVKKCPGCSTPIEKIHGCNKMTCMACNISFCWLCCEAFNTDQSTYDHLNTHHGGVFEY